MRSIIEMISSTEESTKTPTGTINGGNLSIIFLAASDVIMRGLPFAKTNPSESAPRSAAINASSLFVIPQIFTRIV